MIDRSTTAWLGIGTNVDAERNYAAAVAALREAFGAVRLSPVYRCRAVGFEGQDFLNGVAAVETTLEVEELHAWLHALEDRHGRRRDRPDIRDRILDIDILLFGDAQLQAPGLVLPRPEIFRFAHVLRPLVDLAPELQLPGDGRRVAEVWALAPFRDTPMTTLPAGFPD